MNDAKNVTEAGRILSSKMAGRSWPEEIAPLVKVQGRSLPMANELDLPTMAQILRQADFMHGIPMTDEELADWFEQTVELNRRRREMEHDGK